MLSCPKSEKLVHKYVKEVQTFLRCGISGVKNLDWNKEKSKSQNCTMLLCFFFYFVNIQKHIRIMKYMRKISQVIQP